MSTIYEKTPSYQGQSSLADFCRTGTYHPIKNVKEKHVHHYRRLVFNVVNDTLQTTYPLTYELLHQEEWDEIVHHFWSHYQCQSTQLWMMPKEFYTYIKLQDFAIKESYPFLLDLLWFEWLEVQYFLQEDTPSSFPYTKKGKLETDALVINPELSIEPFSYPVFSKVASDISEQDKGTYFLAVFRRQDEEGEVVYTTLSAPFVRCLEYLQTQPFPLKEMTTNVCGDLGIPYSQEILEKVNSFVKEALNSNLIVGFAK